MSKTVALQINAATTQCYADTVNARYNNEASNFETIKQRIENAIAKLPIGEQAAVRGKLIAAAKQWRANFPNRKKWGDLELCSAVPMKLSQILIDDTTQRELLINWCDKIVRTWRDCQAMPISVYPITKESMEQIAIWDGQSQLYAAWDGQHTGIAFYIIAVWALDLDPSEVEVPVVLYKSSERAQIRKTFIGKNSPEGNSMLSKYEIFRQQVLGVRLDGFTILDWLEAEAKQSHIEKAKLFVTAENAYDSNMPGAISRMKEINMYSPAVIKDFCTYASAIQKLTPRAIDTLEIGVMCHYFNMGRTASRPVVYTEEEIIDLANHLYDLFGGNFRLAKDSTSIGPFWSRVKSAYTEWWNNYYGDDDDAPEKMVFKAIETTGVPFLYYQLRNTWKKDRVPTLNFNTPIRPSLESLF